jgi:acetolactate synthase-1/2/3 large subunit
MLYEVGLLRVRSREEEAARWREKAVREARERSPGLARLAGGIRRVLPRDAIMSLDATTAGYWMANHLPMYEPRTLLNPRNFLTLGFAFPAALGAKVAHPDRAVVSVVGDGGFMFTSQELATAMLHGLSVPILLFNDSSFGAVKRDQAGRYCGRTIGVDLKNPDFVLFARAFGAEGVRAERLEDVGGMLGEALGRPVPTLIEIPWHVMEGA